MADIFLPHMLSPQGWLNDILLAQIYHDDFEEIRELIYNGASSSLTEAAVKDLDSYNYLLATSKNKVFSLHPSFKNLLETEYINKTPNKPASNSTKNKEINEKYVKFLSCLTTPQIAAMQPYVRLYVKTREGNQPWSKARTREIKFKTFADIDRLTQYKSNLERGEGAGIKRLTVERTYPYAGFKLEDFRISIDYKFRSMAVFARGADTPNKTTADGWKLEKDYIKLISPLKPALDPKTGKTKREERLYLEYGWHISDSVSDDIISKEIKHIFKEQEKKVLVLKWIKHDFDFKENGEVNLAVQYIGVPLSLLYHRDEEKPNNILEIRNEKLLKSLAENENNKADFIDTVEEFKRINNLREQIKLLNKRCKEVTDEAEARTLKEEIKQISFNLEKATLRSAGTIQQVILNTILRQEQLLKAQFKSKKTGEGYGAKHEINCYISGQSPDDLEHWEDIERSCTQRVDCKQVTTKRKVGSADTFYILDAAEVTKKEKEKATVDEKMKRVDEIYSAFFNSMHSSATKAGGQGHSKAAYGNFLFFPLRALIAAIYYLADDTSVNVNPKQTGTNVVGTKHMPFICLGNTLHRSMGKDVWINIGDILIDAGVFQRWFYQTVTSKNITVMTFGVFLDLIMTKLVPMVLGYSTGDRGVTNFGSIKHDEYILGESWDKNKLSFRPGALHDFLSEIYLEPRPSAHLDYLPILAKEFKAGNAKADGPPLIFYHLQASQLARNTEATGPAFNKLQNRNYNQKDDHSRGLYHLNMGSPCGLIKSVNFSYVDNPELRMLLMLRRKRDSLSTFLKYAYSGTASLVGNNLFHKGSFFVIPIKSLGIADEDDPGIAGYYQVHKVVDVLEPGIYTTKVDGTNIYPTSLLKAETIKKVKNSASNQCATKAQIENKTPTPFFLDHRFEKYILEDVIKNPKFLGIFGLKSKPSEYEKEFQASVKKTQAEMNPKKLTAKDLDKLEDLKKRNKLLGKAGAQRDYSQITSLTPEEVEKLSPLEKYKLKKGRHESQFESREAYLEYNRKNFPKG